MKKTIILIAAMLLLTGCSSHGPSMQEVRSICRTSIEDDLCTSQEQICDSYSTALLHPYSSASECRRACEAVEQKFSADINAQGCEQLFDRVSGLCTEYCNSNYK